MSLPTQPRVVRVDVMTYKTASELYIYTTITMQTFPWSSQSQEKHCKTQSLHQELYSGVRMFLSHIQSPKLSRSPEFFRRDRSFCKSLTKHIHKVSPQSHKGTDVLEDLSSLSSNQSSSFSCSSWTSRQSQSSQLQQQSWQGSQSSRWPSLTLHVPPEVQCGPQGV